jgi:hypothetical protein
VSTFEWAEEMKRAAMADAATVCKQAVRIAELEKAITHARVMADHGVYGEMGAVEACDEIHRALTEVVPIK